MPPTVSGSLFTSRKPHEVRILRDVLHAACDNARVRLLHDLAAHELIEDRAVDSGFKVVLVLRTVTCSSEGVRVQTLTVRF